MADILTKEDLKAALDDLPGWTQVDGRDAIFKALEFKTIIPNGSMSTIRSRLR
jgi:pterin-4a-carbinolamine dehydratase